jgi:hypothetical protein
LIFFAVALLFPPRKPWKVSFLLCGMLTLSATIVASMPWKVNYVNAWAIQNYLDANILIPQTSTYSESYIELWVGMTLTQ